MRLSRSLIYTAFVLAFASACSTRESTDADVAAGSRPVEQATVEQASVEQTRDEREADQPTIDAIDISAPRPMPPVAASEAAAAQAGAARNDAAKASLGSAQLVREERAQDQLAAQEAPVAGLIAPMPMAPPPPQVQGYANLRAQPAPEANTENYADFADSGIVRTDSSPVSTFSIDVDTGSYSNVRRMLAEGQLPPRDAVRVEEMLNYFDYGYAAPRDRNTPFAVSTELAAAPWDGKRTLLQVGIQGYDVDRSELPPANIVLLIDTSGSMTDANKLPMLKESFRQLVPQLRAQDRVSMVVYAGSAGLVLAPTPGDHHAEILAALDQLEAGGSTNGGEGIELAYAVAQQAFIPGGVNRVVLATDGDFNVGTFDQQALETRVERARASGIALTTLGFGEGNYNDQMAERLADVGNGNHAYIDTLQEGRKVLVEEMGSTLLTIASDVKIQIEFNPAVVAEYRLIGYENRALAREDFNNDRVDAGEIGAGHDVTAIYELCLVGHGCESSDPLRYGNRPAPGRGDGEIAQLKLRYKLPGHDRSVLMQEPVRLADVHSQAGESLRFAAAVAAYADLLRGGGHVGGFTWDQVESLARGAQGRDGSGYRAEFLRLVAQARSLSAPAQATTPALISQE